LASFACFADKNRFLGAIALLFCVSLANANTLQLARLDGARATRIQLETGGARQAKPLPADLITPLGSLWKLYVHSYLLESGQPESAYVCQGQDRDEVYCCERGERIHREQALVRSCGLYFAPERLGIETRQWRTFWQARQAPAWLSDLHLLRPQTQVAVAELLNTLQSLPAQTAIRAALLEVLLDAKDPKLIGQLGGQVRVKTWSWFAPAADGDTNESAARIGGFAGWLVDGTPIWASAGGTSQSVLARFADVLAPELLANSSLDAGECVDVLLFQRYPIRTVKIAQSAAKTGRLIGDYVVHFDNGNRLPINSQGELILSDEGGNPQLIARLDREDYVARVLDREAAPTPAAAARALAIVIRSYLQQNASRAGECLSINDSSAQQRVAPRLASAAAMGVAAATADLVLSGNAVSYHLDSAGQDRLSWANARLQANAGMRFDEILQSAFPRASLSRWGMQASQCQPLGAATAWLQSRLPTWREQLNAEVGYSEVNEFAVCRLMSGRPFVDRERARIHVRGLHSLQDRLDLTHEYLHLAFAAHPNGLDEVYIEALARRLLGE